LGNWDRKRKGAGQTQDSGKEMHGQGNELKVFVNP
jgi:hypothetical protein